MQHSPTTQWPRIWLLWTCGVLAGMQFAKIAVAFDALQVSYDTTPERIGLALSMVGTVGLACGVIVGLMAPAIGYWRLLLAGLGLGAALSALQSLMLPYPWLMASRALEGASHLAVVVAAPTLIAASCAPRQRSLAMGLWSTFVGVAFAVCAAFGHWFITRAGLGTFFLLHALGMAVACMACAHALEQGPAEHGAANWPSVPTLVRQHVQTYTRLRTALPGLCFLCYTVMAIALMTFLPLAAGNDRPWLAIVLPLVVMAGSLCAGWMAQHRLSPLRLVPLAFGGVAVAGLAVWWCLLAGITIAPAALALMFTAGMAGGASFALVPYLSTESLVHARANGAIAQMGNLGSTCGPPLFAAGLTHFGPAGLGAPVVVFATIGMVLSLRAARYRSLPGS